MKIEFCRVMARDLAVTHRRVHSLEGSLVSTRRSFPALALASALALAPFAASAGAVDGEDRDAPPRPSSDAPSNGAAPIIGVAQTSESLIGLDEVLINSVQLHPMVGSKLKQAEAAQQNLETAKWQRWPAFSASTSVSQIDGNMLTNLRLEQPVWTGGRIDAEIDASASRMAASRAAIDESKLDVLRRIASVYVDAIRLGDRLAAAEENVSEHERLLALIQRRAANEVSAASEVVTARARLQQALSERSQMMTARANALAEIELAIGQRVSGLKIPLAVRKAWDGELNDVAGAAITFSPKLNRMAAERKASDADLASRRAAIWPQVSARVEEVLGAQQGSIFRTYVGVNFVPGSGLSYRSAVAEAIAKTSALELSREAAIRELRDTVRADWNQTRASRTEVPILQELVKASRETYESSVRQYAIGRKNWLDVLNARREASQARFSLADTLWGGFSAGLRLEIVTGSLPLLGPLVDNAAVGTPQGEPAGGAH